MEIYELPPLPIERPAVLSPMECPRCGESVVVHQEHVVQLREVLGVQRDGRLCIAMQVNREQAPDAGPPARLRCEACCYLWPVSGDVEWQP